MANALAFDTTFMIDFQRERASRPSDGGAHRFLREHAGATLRLPATALGEFAEGFARDDDPVLLATARCFEVLPVDRETALRYGALVRTLRAEGRLIGTNDLWIAACALRHAHPLVTRNTEEFSRVPGLTVLGY